MKPKTDTIEAAVERLTLQNEKELNRDQEQPRVHIIRDTANAIRCLDALGWLRDKPNQ